VELFFIAEFHLVVNARLVVLGSEATGKKQGNAKKS
jgi:hypothetical protein